MTFQDVQALGQLAGAALGGGALYKIIDLFLKKRMRNAQADKTLSGAAMDHIDRLVKDIERANELAELFKKESEQCRKNYEELRVAMTDLKIALRSVYEYMSSHADLCPAFQREEKPHIPKNLLS